ncbi:hypothetical protein [Bacillus sp. FSL K6-3431]|uniref:hypothetical protein n=1 Tax=Bacillus sp. FSL K6-3431 TaxID=2921500 RepID=UPI0030FCDD6E
MKKTTPHIFTRIVNIKIIDYGETEIVSIVKGSLLAIIAIFMLSIVLVQPGPASAAKRYVALPSSGKVRNA